MPPPLPPSNTRRRKVPNKANKLPPTYKKRSIAADEGVPLTIKTTSNIVSPTKSSKDQSSPIKKSIHPKEKQILHVLSQPQIDLWALRELCVTDGGLISGKKKNIRLTYVLVHPDIPTLAHLFV